MNSFVVFLQVNWIFSKVLVVSWSCKMENSTSLKPSVQQPSIILIGGLICRLSCTTRVCIGSPWAERSNPNNILKNRSIWISLMKHLASCASTSPKSYSFTLREWEHQNNYGRSLIPCLASRMRWGVIFWRMSWFHYNPSTSKQYNIFSQKSNNLSCNASNAGLTRRMSDWCSQFWAKLAQNSQFSYLPFTLRD